MAVNPVQKIKLLTLFIAVSAIIVGSMFFIGHFSIRQMLHDDAERRASLWLDQALLTVGDDSNLLTDRIRSGALERTLETVGIDAVFLIGSSGSLDRLSGPADAGEELTDHSANGPLPSDDPATTTFSETRFGLLSGSSVKIWSILPTGTDTADRLAIRVSQSDSAGLLRYSFRQELFMNPAPASYLAAIGT